MSGLAARQREFARHIRNPALYPLPAGVEPRRMRIYNELIYNTVEGFAAGGFPVLRALLDDADWHALVRAFVDGHRCHTPYFLKISEEFIDFVAGGAGGVALPPFALELVHYEWVELALDVAEDEHAVPGADPDADLLCGIPVQSPLAWALAYAFPVHRIGPGYRPAEASAEPTRLIVYRNREERVKFIETDALTLRLLELIEPGTHTGRAVLEAVATELGQAGNAALIEAGAATLGRLRELGILSGAVKSCASGGHNPVLG